MQTITVSHEISMGHRLPSYEGICSSPHGHNVKIEVEVESIDFIDFKEVRSYLVALVESFDHAMVLFKDDPLLRLLEEMGFRVVHFPTEPTTEAIARYIFISMQQIPYSVVRVTVHETSKYSATVRRDHV